MTQCFLSDSRRGQHIPSVLAKIMEGHFSFPRGVLEQGRITHFPSDVNKAVWTGDGGVVACSDENLAASIVRVIAEHGEEDYVALLSKLQETLSKSLPAASCRLDVSFYCCGSPISLNSNLRESVEMLRPCDLEENFTPPDTEHVFAIRAGSVVASRAYNIPQLKVDDHWVHAIAAGTHPDYRKRGFGKAVVSALVEHITSEDSVALWNCDAKNVASLKLARSVGFVEYARVFSWEVEEIGKAKSSYNYGNIGDIFYASL